MESYSDCTGPWDRDGVYIPRRRDLKSIRRNQARLRLAEILEDELYSDLTLVGRIKLRLSMKMSHPFRGGEWERLRDIFSRWYLWNVRYGDSLAAKSLRRLRTRLFGPKVSAERRGVVIARAILADCEKAGIDPKGDPRNLR